MSSTDLRPQATLTAAQLTRSPAWLPLDVLENGAVRLLQLDEDAYRAASFLDQRMLRPGVPQASCAPAELAAAAAQLRPAAHFIFHIGHVGSTLLSRLLGEDPRLFCLREPHLLRVLAGRPRTCPLPLPALLALLSRVWRPQQRALVKATSFVGEIAGAALAATPGAVAILMYTPAATYLRSILGGPNSRIEARSMGPSRLARLRARVAPLAIPEPRSEGELIAMSWLCEMAALCQAAESFPKRVRWLEFERFLRDPASGLATAFTALGVAPDARVIEAAVGGPLLHRYSKAPEHAYDAALRRAVLESAEQEHGGEVRRGVQWLAGLAGSHRWVDQALALSAAGG